jgi:tetratricopeptide (TPR) repeat protein
MIPYEQRAFAFQVVDMIASAMRVEPSLARLADRFAEYAKHRLTLEPLPEPDTWWLEVESAVGPMIDAYGGAFSYQNPSERGNLNVLQVLVLIGHALPVSLNFKASLWFGLGITAQEQQQRELAVVVYNRALNSFRQLDLEYPGQFRSDVAKTLNNLGALLSDIGQRQAAKEHYEEALKIRWQLDLEYPGQFRDYVATTLNNLGNLLSNMGQRQAAKEHYEQALAIRRQLNLDYPGQFRNDVAITLNNLGSLQRHLGQRQASKEHYAEALKIYRQLDLEYPSQFRNEIARTLNNLGNLLMDRGERQAVKEHYEEALKIYRQLDLEYPGQFRNDVARTLNNLGNSLSNIDQRKASQEHYEEALNLYRQLDLEYPGQFRNYVAGTLHNLGAFLSDIGEQHAAEKQYAEALEIYRELDLEYPGQFRNDVAQTLNNLGNLLSDMGERQAVKKHYEEALKIYRQDRRFSPEQHLRVIRDLLNGQFADEAQLLMKEALEVCELMAGELRSFQDRLLWSRFATEFGTRLAFAAHHAGDRQTGGLAFEHGQALSLKASVLGPLREKMLDLQAQARENPEFAKQEELRELEAFIADDSLDWTLPRLEAGELAIGWAVEETETLVVTYRGSEDGTVVESHLVPVGSVPLWEGQPNGKQVRTRPSWNGILRRFKNLSRVLDTCPLDLLDALFPSEVRAQIAEAQQVYLLPTGNLLDVPMRAIRLSDGELLFRNATPSYPLSLDLMLRARKAPRLAGETPLLFGINEYGDEIPSVDPDRAIVRAGLSTLTHAVPEVEAVAGLHGVTPDKLLTEQDATLGRMKAEWWKSRWLHIAVHGEFNPYDVYSSRLFLYNENGVLDSITLGELMADRLRIQKEGGVQTKVVFLACCFGGKGTAIGGEGEVSIAYALLSNGVQCVVAAQWAAVDKVAHDLMIATHKHWLTGATIAESVHAAQVEVGKSTPVEHATVFNVFGDGTVRL